MTNIEASTPAQEALLQLLGRGSHDDRDENCERVMEIMRTDEKFESFGLTELHSCLLGLSDYDLTAYLKQSTTAIDIDARDSLGLTPLNWACLRGDRAGVELLLQWNADPNITDLNGNSAIQQATDHGQADIARCLVHAGAKGGKSNRWKNTPLHRAARFHASNVPSLEILCNVAPEVLNQGNMWKETALHIAAFYGHVDNVIFLVQQGADLEAVDEIGETPIFKATENNQLDSIKVFIEAGCCLDVANASGTHLLSSVALHASPRVMEVLVPEIVRRLGSDTERRVKTKAWALLNGERDRTCYGSRQSIEEERNIFASLLRLDSDSMLYSPYQDSNKDDGSIYESASEYQ